MNGRQGWDFGRLVRRPAQLGFALGLDRVNTTAKLLADRIGLFASASLANINERTQAKVAALFLNLHAQHPRARTTALDQQEQPIAVAIAPSLGRCLHRKSCQTDLSNRLSVPTY
jgi:hypothetical protein